MAKRITGTELQTTELQLLTTALGLTAAAYDHVAFRDLEARIKRAEAAGFVKREKYPDNTSTLALTPEFIAAARLAYDPKAEVRRKASADLQARLATAHTA